VQNSVGILQNRLTFAISLAQSQVVNKKAAESRIRDANIAEESANLTRYNILNQSGIAALAQANQSSASVLSLLGRSGFSRPGSKGAGRFVLPALPSLWPGFR
jgi:flagellin